MLKISENGARLEHEVGGSTILYVPCGFGAYQKIRRSCRDARTLVVDEPAVDDAVVAEHVKGWRDVVDSTGEPVEFTMDAFAKLSWGIVQGVLAAILTQATEEVEQQGNSGSSSST